MTEPLAEGEVIGADLVNTELDATTGLGDHTRHLHGFISFGGRATAAGIAVGH